VGVFDERVGLHASNPVLEPVKADKSMDRHGEDAHAEPGFSR
jgi:hypothetical protein